MITEIADEQYFGRFEEDFFQPYSQAKERGRKHWGNNNYFDKFDNDTLFFF